jgi:Arc/MetJ family transcription regulator
MPIILSPNGDTIDALGEFMRTTVALDDDLLKTAQDYSGEKERTALLRLALKALIHLEASRRLVALKGSMPELENIPRTRVDAL